MRHKMISVFGAEPAEFTPELCSFAEVLGTRLARKHFGVICDGREGISEQVCRALVEADHDAPVVALVNGSDIKCHNQYCSVVIPTGQAWGADRLVANGGDVVVVLGGGVPAVSLLDFLCTNGSKQVLCLLGVSPLIDEYAHNHVGNDHLIIVKTVDEILWYLDVMAEDFSLLPSKKSQSGSDSSRIHRTVSNSALL